MGAALKTRRTVRTAAELAESLLERRNPAVARRLTATERTVELAAAGVFLVVAAVMGATAAPEPVVTATLLVVSYALVRRVRFQLGTGLIRPTQIVFVPMLFLTPAAAVPLLVTLGGVLGELPDLLRRRAHPERLAVVIADGWYAIGPALAVALLDQQTTLAVLLIALVAQFACDLGASSAREYFGARILPSELLPVLALVYLMDATLAPIGFLAVLASEVYENAYLLAIAPAALLGLIARERSERIARELELERAFRRSTRALDARADDVRRQAGRVQSGDAEPEDRRQLERVLLATTVEALRADAGRLSEIDDHGILHARLAIGDLTPALELAELALGSPQANALAIGVGHSHVLAVMRAQSPFSAVERDLLEHLAAQAAVTLENLRLEELMRRKEAELRAILEGVADGIAAEDPDGRLVFVNAAAARLLNGADSLGAALGVAPTLLPGRHVFEGEHPEPLVVKHAHRWSRVKARPGARGRPSPPGDQRRRGHHRDQAGRGGAAVPLRGLARARGLAAARPHAAGGGSPRRRALRRRVRDRARRAARDRRRNRRSDAHPAAARRRAARWAAASITPPRASSRCGSGRRSRTLACTASARRSRTRSSSRCSRPSCRRSRAWTAPRCTGRRARSTRSAATSTTCSRSAAASGSRSSATSAARAPRPPR